jgi:flagellin
MGLRINTNVASINAQRNLKVANEKQADTFAKLSSGSRITKAADDSAGLAISENLKAQVRGLRQANRNASDGISMVQTAEGGLNEISSMLVRLRELSVQSASDTIGDKERGFVNVEFQQLKNEIQRISEVTQYNGTKLLDGTGPDKLDFQVGINNNEFQDRITYQPGEANASLDALNMSSESVADKSGAQNSLATIDQAMTHVNSIRANLGALQNRLNSTINNLGVYEENLSASESRIKDADVAYETAQMTKNNIMSQAGIAVLAQANSSNAGALRLLS